MCRNGCLVVALLVGAALVVWLIASEHACPATIRAGNVLLAGCHERR